MSAARSHGDVRTYRVIICAVIGRTTARGLLLCFGRVAHAYVVDTDRRCNLPMAVEAAPTHTGSDARNELLAVAGCLFIQWQCAAALQGHGAHVSVKPTASVLLFSVGPLVGPHRITGSYTSREDLLSFGRSQFVRCSLACAASQRLHC